MCWPLALLFTFLCLRRGVATCGVTGDACSPCCAGYKCNGTCVKECSPLNTKGECGLGRSCLRNLACDSGYCDKVTLAANSNDNCAHDPMHCNGAQSKPAGPEVVGVCANHSCVGEGSSCEENEDCCFGHCDLSMTKSNSFNFNGGTQSNWWHATGGTCRSSVVFKKALVKSAPSKQFYYRERHLYRYSETGQMYADYSSCESARQGMGYCQSVYKQRYTANRGILNASFSPGTIVETVRDESSATKIFKVARTIDSYIQVFMMENIWGNISHEGNSCPCCGYNARTGPQCTRAYPESLEYPYRKKDFVACITEGDGDPDQVVNPRCDEQHRCSVGVAHKFNPWDMRFQGIEKAHGYIFRHTIGKYPLGSKVTIKIATCSHCSQDMQNCYDGIGVVKSAILPITLSFVDRNQMCNVSDTSRCESSACNRGGIVNNTHDRVRKRSFKDCTRLLSKNKKPDNAPCERNSQCASGSCRLTGVIDTLPQPRSVNESLIEDTFNATKICYSNDDCVGGGHCCRYSNDARLDAAKKC